jgi:hypothetical protein
VYGVSISDLQMRLFQKGYTLHIIWGRKGRRKQEERFILRPCVSYSCPATSGDKILFEAWEPGVDTPRGVLRPTEWAENFENFRNFLVTRQQKFEIVCSNSRKLLENLKNLHFFEKFSKFSAHSKNRECQPQVPMFEASSNHLPPSSLAISSFTKERAEHAVPVQSPCAYISTCLSLAPLVAALYINYYRSHTPQ